MEKMDTDITIELNTDDLILLEKAKSGDRSSFNRIVLKYQKKIFSFVIKLVNDYDDASDVTQDVFIRFYYAIDNFRGESKLLTYLYRIAYNLSINCIKKRNKHRSKHIDINDENINFIKDDRAGETNIENEERKNIIADAISTLPDKQKAIFNLRFYDNMSYDEISVITGTSVGGLKANYFHAFKKIELLLKNSKLFNSSLNVSSDKYFISSHFAVCFTKSRSHVQ